MPAEDSILVLPQEGSQQQQQHTQSSLIIPISSNKSNKTNNFIEIFPDELVDIPSSTLLHILKEEDAPLEIWANVGLAYMQESLARESSAILQAGCERPWGQDKTTRVRLLASAGIAHLAASEDKQMADTRFTSASKLETFFPMTWSGKGMYNLLSGRLDQARFFFDTTLKQCGNVLPGLLGMANVLYQEGQYRSAQDYYSKAIRLYPETGGAPTRVGFAITCYQLGQIDRAKAAMERALALDPNYVPAMVGAAMLDMASMDSHQADFAMKRERAMKQMSMANLLDHSNAMVQNHLANHYFWKWTPVVGTVSVVKGSKVVTGSQPIPLDSGERIRIGLDMETTVEEEREENTTFTMRSEWKGESQSGLKVWKKDYDRVMALAKGAYNSTQVQEIQAESLFLLARVHHVREDMDNAHKLYERAVKLAPDLSPARFGLAQTLIAQEEYAQASAHLKLVLGTSLTATDALAALGLLEVKSGNDKEGLLHLKKAIDLDPLNPDLQLLEALALQQQKANYAESLQKYKKAVELLEASGRTIPYEMHTNIGVLCFETQRYEESIGYYTKALNVLGSGEAQLNNEGVAGGPIRHAGNNMFFDYIDTSLIVESPPVEGSDTLTVTGEYTLKAGDHVQIGDAFFTDVLEVNGTNIKVKENFLPPTPDESDLAEFDYEVPSPATTLIKLKVKRENKRLDNSQAITIAFNIARVHEAAGTPLAAIELHKAIVKRVPTYVNSYLRLACIARDCGSLKECSAWLKIACAVAPGNPEVLTLVGNLHLSLCDWPPAQSIFNQLLQSKATSVEAYSNLSLGNIYFANLSVPGKYAKHLEYAAQCYKQILRKDKDNAYAANGIGSVLAEMGELFKAKEAFNRVREVSGDTIADAHLNLGHIYLAQKKHAEALQMYQSYMKRTQDGSAPITTKSREDDVAEVLLYIAFAYFDWARQTELFNNAQAAPADERYKLCIEHLEAALQKSKRKEVIIEYNLCMTRLQAANCVLQKLTRNIRRTALEVEEALKGLEESLPKVEEMLRWKNEGKKVVIASSMLQDFITHCKANIESAKSHLDEERKREEEANEIRELQRAAAESQRKEEEIHRIMEEEAEVKRQEERDKRAAAKMHKVRQLQEGWEQEAQAKKDASEKKKKVKKGDAPPVDDDDDLFDDDDVPANNNTAALFDDSDDDDDDDEPDKPHAEKESDDGAEMKAATEPDSKEHQQVATEQDLFGESSDEESDEELLPKGTKRDADKSAGGGEVAPTKKRRVLDDDDDGDSNDE